MVEEAIRSILLSDSTISQCVDTRIFPLEVPLDSPLPALSISIISDPYKQVSGSPRVQVSCWSMDYTECHYLKKSVTEALEGYTGLVNGVNIIRIIPIDAPDYYNANTRVYHIPIDFKVIIRK
jgi:hypothetical protein